MAQDADIRLSREHRIHKSRAERQALNITCVQGGDAYIDQRLSRLPYESEASWSGAVAGASWASKSKLPTAGPHGDRIGRKGRAYNVNYAGRIAQKINQYVFATTPKRENINDDFSIDASRTGRSIDDVMREVSTLLTCSGWCWIGIDRGGITAPIQAPPRSMLAKELSGDRVFWTVWRPDSVVDWHFDQAGKLVWLITEEFWYSNSDPTVKANENKVRTIWQAGGGTRLFVDAEDKEKIAATQEFNLAANIVPFVPVGDIHDGAIQWDDVERIQAAILNLSSVHQENLFQTVYPQLVLPSGMVQDIQQALGCSGEQALEMVRGLAYPILEPSASSGQTRYLIPSASDLAAIPNEMQRLRKELFDVVGMALQNETRQVESAEAKAWDHLDPECVIRDRAILLEEAEARAVALSAQMDTTFADYTPEYARSFDVSNLAEDIAAIMQVGNMELPEEGRKELQRIAVNVLDRKFGIEAARKQEIMDAIDESIEVPMDETPLTLEKDASVNNAAQPPAQ
jgi:hypothetical protein